MRKLIFAIFLLTLMFSLSFAVSAEGDEMLSLPPEFGDFISDIPSDVADGLGEGFFSGDAYELYNSVFEMWNLGSLLSTTSDAFGLSLREVLPTAGLLFGVVALSALGNVFAEGFLSVSGRIFGICARLCILTVTVSGAVLSLSSLEEYLHNLSAVSAAFLPLSGTLYAMGGNLSTATASTASLGAALSICNFVSAYTILPFFCICLAFSVVSSCEMGVDMSSICGYVKKTYTSLIGFLMFVISTALASQSILASRADSASMKGVKFFVGMLIPVTGGTVSSSLGSFSAAIELMRTSVGMGGIIILLMLLLPVIIRLFVLRAVYSAAAYFAGLLGARGEQGLLLEISSLYGYLAGILVLCSVVTFISFALLIFCTSAVGL